MNSIYAAVLDDSPGLTRIVVAGRISASRDPAPIVSDALDYEGARFLAQCLAIATGGAVHLTYLNADGEHNFKMQADDFPAIGPGLIDRSFLLSK